MKRIEALIPPAGGNALPQYVTGPEQNLKT